MKIRPIVFDVKTKGQMLPKSNVFQRAPLHIYLPITSISD